MSILRRGERMARWMLDKIDAAGLRVRFLKIDGEWAIETLNPRPMPKEVTEAAVDLTMFAIGYPRNFGTLIKLYNEREAAR